jgi:hypothetical protein
MVDEKLIIKKLELLKASSKEVMGNHLYMKQKHLEYFLDLLIKYINNIRYKI